MTTFLNRLGKKREKRVLKDRFVELFLLHSASRTNKSTLSRAEMLYVHSVAMES